MEGSRTPPRAGGGGWWTSFRGYAQVAQAAAVAPPPQAAPAPPATAGEGGDGDGPAGQGVRSPVAGRSPARVAGGSGATPVRAAAVYRAQFDAMRVGTPLLHRHRPARVSQPHGHAASDSMNSAEVGAMGHASLATAVVRGVDAQPLCTTAGAALRTTELDYASLVCGATLRARQRMRWADLSLLAVGEGVPDASAEEVTLAMHASSLAWSRRFSEARGNPASTRRPRMLQLSQNDEWMSTGDATGYERARMQLASTLLAAGTSYCYPATTWSVSLLESTSGRVASFNAQVAKEWREKRAARDVARVRAAAAAAKVAADVATMAAAVQRAGMRDRPSSVNPRHISVDAHRTTRSDVRSSSGGSKAAGGSSRRLAASGGGATGVQPARSEVDAVNSFLAKRRAKMATSACEGADADSSASITIQGAAAEVRAHADGGAVAAVAEAPSPVAHAQHSTLQSPADGVDASSQPRRSGVRSLDEEDDDVMVDVHGDGAGAVPADCEWWATEAPDAQPAHTGAAHEHGGVASTDTGVGVVQLPVDTGTGADAHAVAGVKQPASAATVASLRLPSLPWWWPGVAATPTSVTATAFGPNGGTPGMRGGGSVFHLAAGVSLPLAPAADSNELRPAADAADAGAQPPAAHPQPPPRLSFGLRSAMSAGVAAAAAPAAAAATPPSPSTSISLLAAGAQDTTEHATAPMSGVKRPRAQELGQPRALLARAGGARDADDGSRGRAHVGGSAAAGADTSAGRGSQPGTITPGAVVPHVALALRPAEWDGIAEWTRRCDQWRRAFACAWGSVQLHARSAGAAGMPLFYVRCHSVPHAGNVLLFASVAWLARVSQVPLDVGITSGAEPTRAADDSPPQVVILVGRSSQSLRRRLAAADVHFATPADNGLCMYDAGGSASRLAAAADLAAHLATAPAADGTPVVVPAHVRAAVRQLSSAVATSDLGTSDAAALDRVVPPSYEAPLRVTRDQQQAAHRPLASFMPPEIVNSSEAAGGMRGTPAAASSLLVISHAPSALRFAQMCVDSVSPTRPVYVPAGASQQLSEGAPLPLRLWCAGPMPPGTSAAILQRTADVPTIIAPHPFRFAAAMRADLLRVQRSEQQLLPAAPGDKQLRRHEVRMGGVMLPTACAGLAAALLQAHERAREAGGDAEEDDWCAPSLDEDECDVELDTTAHEATYLFPAVLRALASYLLLSREW